MGAARPDFDDPPLVEQAITVGFEPIPGFSLAHYGIYWSRIRRDFPRTRQEMHLDNQQEFEKLELIHQRIVMTPAGGSLPRLMLEGDRSELLQLQDDRFSFNWAKTAADAEYPRWTVTLPRFRALIDSFFEFVRDEGLPAPVINQAEVTNFNIIPVAGVEAVLTEMETVFGIDQLDLKLEGLQPDTYDRVRQHRIVDDEGRFLGRLHVTLGPAFAQQPSAERPPVAIRYEITARSSRKRRTVDEACEFLARGHDDINRTFMAMTTETAHQRWGEIK